MSLRSIVKRFVSEARERPHLAVTREVLNELDREADRSFNGAFAADHMAIAKTTWMVRDLLSSSSDESEGATLEIGEPVEIVGCLPTIIWIPERPSSGTTPHDMILPLDFFDVNLVVDRHERLTAAEKRSASDRSNYVNMPALSIMNRRMWGLRLDSASPKLSIQCRWAVDAATRAAIITSGGVAQFSFNFFIRPLRTQ